MPDGAGCLVSWRGCCRHGRCVCNFPPSFHQSEKNSNGKNTDINTSIRGAAGPGPGPRGCEHGHHLAMGFAVNAGWARLEGESGLLSVPPGQVMVASAAGRQAGAGASVLSYDLKINSGFIHGTVQPSSKTEHTGVHGT